MAVEKTKTQGKTQAKNSGKKLSRYFSRGGPFYVIFFNINYQKIPKNTFLWMARILPVASCQRKSWRLIDPTCARYTVLSHKIILSLSPGSKVHPKYVRFHSAQAYMPRRKKC